jgi:integrase
LVLEALERAENDEGRRDRVLFGVMLATGIRVGTVLALGVEGVDLGRGELYLRSTKGDRPFVVFFSERIAALLRGHLRDRVEAPLREPARAAAQRAPGPAAAGPLVP